VAFLIRTAAEKGSREKLLFLKTLPFCRNTLQRNRMFESKAEISPIQSQ